MKKSIILVVLMVLTLGGTQAQEKPLIGYTPSSYYTFSWNIAFPLGDLNDWVNQPGFAGFDFGGRYKVTNSLYAGFNIAWQRIAKIYEDETFTIPEKGIAINAENYRFTWMVPFQAVIAYHLNPGKMISPYLGLGIGGDYMEHHMMIQEYDIYETAWDFSLTPEIGLLAKFGAYSNWGGIIAFNYKWTTNKIDIYQERSKNLQMLNLKVGISMIIR